MARRALLLVGSPRVPSNSEALGSHLLGLLAAKGWEAEKARVPLSGRGGEASAAVARADLVMLSFPLYVDALPSHLTAFLEDLAAERRKGHLARSAFALSQCSGATADRPQTLVGVCQNGFPEAFHNLSALALLKSFASESGFAWGGGLAMGMGAAIGRKPIAAAGGMLRRQLKAMGLAADALDRGHAVPAKAMELMARPLIPRWLYLLIGNRGWKAEARKHGTGARLRDRPYGE
jgi:hypothetical protein